jgi:hypothetical protein
MPGDAIIKLRALRIRQDAESASRLSQTVSSSSAFSAGERLLIWLRRSLICLQP